MATLPAKIPSTQHTWISAHRHLLQQTQRFLNAGTNCSKERGGSGIATQVGCTHHTDITIPSGLPTPGTCYSNRILRSGSSARRTHVSSRRLFRNAYSTTMKYRLEKTKMQQCGRISYPKCPKMSLCLSRNCSLADAWKPSRTQLQTPYRNTT